MLNFFVVLIVRCLIALKTDLLVIDFQEGSLQHKVALLVFLKDFKQVDEGTEDQTMILRVRIHFLEQLIRKIIKLTLKKDTERPNVKMSQSDFSIIII
jgi:hypothetical protein